MDRASEKFSGMGVQQVKSLDVDDLLERVAGDWEFLKELIGLYFENAEKLMENIRRALQTGDADQLAHEAHTLKGMVANFTREGEVYHAAAHLEQLARNGNLENAPEAFQDLEMQVSQFEPELRELAERPA